MYLNIRLAFQKSQFLRLDSLCSKERRADGIPGTRGELRGASHRDGVLLISCLRIMEGVATLRVAGDPQFSTKLLPSLFLGLCKTVLFILGKGNIADLFMSVLICAGVLVDGLVRVVGIVFGNLVAVAGIFVIDIVFVVVIFVMGLTVVAGTFITGPMIISGNFVRGLSFFESILVEGLVVLAGISVIDLLVVSGVFVIGLRAKRLFLVGVMATRFTGTGGIVRGSFTPLDATVDLVTSVRVLGLVTCLFLVILLYLEILDP